MIYEYTPQGVCSRKFIIEVEDGIVKNVEIIGGCEGNTKGVCNLAKDMPVKEVIKRLKGIDCKGRGTSCPDQLSKALEEIEE